MFRSRGWSLRVPGDKILQVDLPQGIGPSQLSQRAYGHRGEPFLMDEAGDLKGRQGDFEAARAKKKDINTVTVAGPALGKIMMGHAVLLWGRRGGPCVWLLAFAPTLGGSMRPPLA